MLNQVAALSVSKLEIKIKYYSIRYIPHLRNEKWLICKSTYLYIWIGKAFKVKISFNFHLEDNFFVYSGFIIIDNQPHPQSERERRLENSVYCPVVNHYIDHLLAVVFLHRRERAKEIRSNGSYALLTYLVWMNDGMWNLWCSWRKRILTKTRVCVEAARNVQSRNAGN